MSAPRDYAEAADRYGRQTNLAVEISFKRCANVFGQAPCRAVDRGDGTRCAYSFTSCQDPLNFSLCSGTRVFTSTDHGAVCLAPAPSDLLGGGGSCPFAGLAPLGAASGIVPGPSAPGSFAAYGASVASASSGLVGVAAPVSGLVPGAWHRASAWLLADADGVATVRVAGPSGICAAPGGTWTSGAADLLSFSLAGGSWRRVEAPFMVPGAFASGTPCTVSWGLQTASQGRSLTVDGAAVEGPLQAGPASRPYLARVTDNPQEIDLFKGETTAHKLAFDMNLDWYPPPEDFDKAVRNSGTGGEYWHVLFARNKNYPNCPVRVLEGFSDLPYDAWRQVADMRLTGWTVNGTSAHVESLDLLSLASKVELPFTVPDTDYVIGDAVSGFKAAETRLKVTSNKVLPDPAAYPGLKVFVEVGGTDGFKDDANPNVPSELMEVLAVSGSGQGHEYLQVRRGAYGTAARDFLPVSGVSCFRWRHVYVAGAEGTASSPELCTRNAVDVLRELVLWAGVPADRIDDASFAAAKAAFYPTLNFSRRIDSPTAVSDLLAEVNGSLTSTVFVDGEHRVSCRVVGPPGASETVPTLTDGADILEGSVTVEDDPSTRITRCFVYFYPRTNESSTDPKDFNRCAGVVDEELEAPQSYGDVVADWRTSSWFVVDESDATVKDIVRRRIALLRDGTRKITFRVDARNSFLDYGDFVRVSTREALGIDGSPDDALYMVVKKSRTNDRSVFEYVGLCVEAVAGRYLFIGPATGMASDYAAAPDADRRIGYFSDADGSLADVSGKVAGYSFT